MENRAYHKIVKIKSVGQTLGGNEVDLLEFTNPDIKYLYKKNIWIMARQHSGEVTSGFMVEGIISFLLSGSESAKYLLDNFVIKLVPMVNIDGVVHGNTRAEFIGCDPNRRWVNPSAHYNPVVYSLKKLI